MPRKLAVALGLSVLAVSALPASVHAQAAKQPEFVAIKADFVPGEKTLFFDDFSDMSAGEAPKRFKARGAAPELRAAGDMRELAFTKSGVLIPNLATLPKNFTYEAEVMFTIPNGWVAANLLLFSKEKEALTFIFNSRATSGEVVLSTKVPKYEQFGRSAVKPTLSQPIRIGLWVQDGRVRVFINDEKCLDVNQVELAPIDRIEIRPEITGAGPTVAVRSVRFAESTPDFSSVLTASGRYVSHAILFDTNSDRIKPESAAAIQTIAKGLQGAPTMKVLIEGHTDATGDAARTLDLSKRRAEAVKGVLVAQFGIDAARLTTNGLGSTKPIDSNDTPMGRAQNRRVEFVKQ